MIYSTGANPDTGMTETNLVNKLINNNRFNLLRVCILILSHISTVGSHKAVKHLYLYSGRFENDEAEFII